jgi:hypothetical protein
MEQVLRRKTSSRRYDDDDDDGDGDGGGGGHLQRSYRKIK